MPLFALRWIGPIAAADTFVNPWWWLAFGLLVAVLLGVDLLVIHRRGREPTMAASAVTVAAWCLLALGFNGLVWWLRGGTAAVQFLSGYLLEWSMSMDNVFVFAVIFRYFQVPKEHQYRILFWGILGAVQMRLGFILAGAALVARFDFVLPLFGIFLIYTAYRLARHSAKQIDPSRSLVYRIAQRWLPAPLLVLLIVETTDLLFAVDSIPAIFGITKDPFIIFTSNVFAILGLRALYFLLAGMIDTFRYLHYGLAAVLAFVGLKMVAEGWLPHEAGKELMPAWASLVIIAVLLGTAIMASVAVERRKQRNSQ
jgi:tellurite resistance protein TerC